MTLGVETPLQRIGRGVPDLGQSWQERAESAESRIAEAERERDEDRRAAERIVWKVGEQLGQAERALATLQAAVRPFVPKSREGLPVGTPSDRLLDVWESLDLDALGSSEAATGGEPQGDETEARDRAFKNGDGITPRDGEVWNAAWEAARVFYVGTAEQPSTKRSEGK